ncbi:hypothetical protein F2Q69_00055543 [Brassica cretica]|uniref:Uncharacterized protein n=1 Tax=Brassica cretica TaxID=69181 RepID=A0A8S9MVB5_BRACR|nr:hypothetical protein F2Q69_00055543 [Brassica cretica]
MMSSGCENLSVNTMGISGIPENLESLQRISTFSREKGDLRSNPAYGRRVSVRAGVGSFLLPSKRWFPLGGKTRSRGGPWCGKIGLHVQVVIPGDGGYHRSVDASFFPGGGGFLSFAAAGSSSREGEVFSAPSSPVLALEGRGSHSSTLSVLVPEGWLFGSEWMRSRYKVKLFIIGDDDKRRKAEVLSLGLNMPSRRRVMIGMSSRLVR